MTRSLAGSRRAEATALPSWIKPQLTKLVDQPPEGPEWLHEIKFDGYRMHARLDRGAVRLLTRTGLDWTHNHPAIAAVVASLPAREAYLDGELCGVRPDGTTSFSDPERIGHRQRRCSRLFPVWERLAQAWGISLASWDELRSAGFVLPPASFDNPAVIRDLAAFTRRFAEAYFRTVAEALRRHDPDHLYLGSRFAWRTPEAVEACAHWCDVVSFNLYKPSIANDGDEWARFHALGKPALIGEFHFGSSDRGLFWEGLVGAGKESERGPAYARYLRAVADNPDFVGAHWFQYIDEPLTGRTLDGENAHVGFVTVADLPYVDLVAAARDANLSVLHELQRGASPGASE